MQIRIGDEVSFLSEKLDGKVTSIIDANTVNVYCDIYGFEIPASINDLVVTRSTLDGGSVSESNRQTNLPGINTQCTNNVWVAFIPDNHSDLQHSRFDLYLVNDTKETILYTIAIYNGEQYNGLSAGNINPETSLQLGTYNLKDIEAKIKTLMVQYLTYKRRSSGWESPTESAIKITPASLCKSGAYRNSRYFKGVAFIREIGKESVKEYDVSNIENNIEEPHTNTKIVLDKKILKELNAKMNQDRKSQSGIKEQKEVNPNIIEVDLHANALLETTAGMDSGAILEFQMEVFVKTMEKYKLHKGQKIVFIHGKGEGILRQRIMWLLQTTYKRHNHQDASFKQYGFGATMVTIR